MIRLATAPDLDAVRAIARAAYLPYVAAIGRDPAPMVADFASQIAENKLRLWVNSDRDASAFIVFYSVPGTMFLENVAVHPDAAGRGIGQALIAACEDAARNLGLPRVQLYTNAKMTGPLRLYPRLGYVETDRRTEDGFDRVFFEKRL